MNQSLDGQGPIVCATRGGEGSEALKLRAATAALEMQRPLLFLYVVDPDSVQPFDDSLRSAVRDELEWLGWTLLWLARDEAEEHGVEASVALREGSIRETISAYSREVDAALVLLGAPRGTTANVFGDDAVERFADELRRHTRVPVEIVRPDAAA